MARKAKYDWGKSRSGKYQKFETRVSLGFDISHDAVEGAYIDVAQCLSLQNRKLVRQGQVFKIKNFRTYGINSNADNAVNSRVSVLPRTWMMFNAYRKARGLWNQMNLEALQGIGVGNLPKYYDFKVYMDRDHFDNSHNSDGGTITANLLPRDAGMNTIAGGDWVYSKYESSDSSSLEWNCHMLGGHATAAGDIEGDSGKDLPADQGSVGLVLAYQQSRGAAFTDQDLAGLDQNIDIDTPWAKLFSASTQDREIMTDLDADNDGPPYPADYAGGIVLPEPHLVSEFMFNEDDYIGHRVGTFEAPMGLIKLHLNTGGSSTDTTNLRVTFDTEIMGPC